MTAARLPCCVPFCRRTTAAGRFDEWLCAKHWPLVSIRLKARKRKAQRLLQRALARGLDKPMIAARAAATWEASKVEAIERAVGI